MPCRGPGEHRQPLAREGLGDVRLGVTHQALELLTRRFDVRDPSTAYGSHRQPSRWSGKPDGPAAREDGGASRRHPVEAGRPASRSRLSVASFEGLYRSQIYSET